MEPEVKSAAITNSESIAIGGFVTIAVGINKKAPDGNKDYNPSLSAYKDICNDPDYKLLLDPNFLDNYTVQYNIQVKEGRIWSYFGFIAQHNKKMNYVMAIRGTQNDFETAADETFFPVQFKEYPKGRVPKGFYDIFENARIVSLPEDDTDISVSLKDLATDILKFLPAAVHKGITVTGHSLGSAVATYFSAAATAGLKKGLYLRLCTFASPFTGDEDFTKTANDSIYEIKRIFNAEDSVPKMPVYLENKKNIYTHVAGDFKIDSTNDSHINHDHFSKAGLACAHQLPVYLYLLNQLEKNEDPNIISAGGDARCRVK